MCWRHAVLEGSIAEQEVDDVTFVRLQPVQRTRWHRADVQAVDVAAVDKFRNPFFVVCDGCADQSRTDFAQHLILRTLNN